MGGGSSRPTYYYHVNTTLGSSVSIKEIYDATWKQSSIGSSQAPYDMNNYWFRAQHNRFVGNTLNSGTTVSLGTFRNKLLYARTQAITTLWPYSN